MAGVLKTKSRIIINDTDCIQNLLQELYNEVCKTIEEIQTQMNRLSTSTNLNEEILDSKAKFAKAMNDFISSKSKAIAQKIDIAKLLSEICKQNGDVGKAIDEVKSTSHTFDAKSLQKLLRQEEERGRDNNVQTYNLR